MALGAVGSLPLCNVRHEALPWWTIKLTWKKKKKGIGMWRIDALVWEAQIGAGGLFDVKIVKDIGGPSQLQTVMVSFSWQYANQNRMLTCHSWIVCSIGICLNSSCFTSTPLVPAATSVGWHQLCGEDVWKKGINTHVCSNHCEGWEW